MNAYQAYRQTQAHTAAPGELVVMLYRGAVRFVAVSIDALEKRDLQGAHNNLLRAQAIISELLATLDIQRGGEVGQNLARIYEYLNHRLMTANVEKDPAPAREVERLLRELLPAWEQAVRETQLTARAVAV
jgi:flagellar secretion chaperone FliS